jgi:ApbE superfamily uncharacterized protein (UPF0280 family)
MLNKVAVTLNKAAVTLSEAKGLILRLRCFASRFFAVLRMTAVALRVTDLFFEL